MIDRKYLASALLAGLVLVGCEKKEETPATPPTKTAAPGAGMMDQAKDKAVEMKDEAVAKAQDIFDKVKTAIADKKFTDADGLLKQLEAMKDKLPDSIKAQLPDLRTTIDAGLKMLNGAMPAMPALPK